MKACTCFLLFLAFAYTNSSPVTTPTEDKRGANLTLKSIPEINVKEPSTNVRVAANKTVIGDNSIPQAHATVETFTDFMQELVIILNTYKDNIFEDFVHIVDKEIKKYPYKRQNEFKSLLAEESNLLMRKSVSAKKAVINQIVDMMKLLKIFDTNVREFLDYINSLYRDDAKKQFRKILTDLKGYSAGYGHSRTKDDFGRLIRDCVRATVFIHNNLNTDVKRKLKKYLDTFMKKIKEFRSSKSSTTNFITSKPTVSKSYTFTVKIAENISTENKTIKPSLKLKPTKTTAHNKVENKRISIFTTNISKKKQEDATITIKTSSNSQQTNITHSNTNETVAEVMFYMTTEKPEIVYKSEKRSQLVEEMFEKESTERQATGQSTTTSGKRLSSKNKLVRSKEISKKTIGRHSLKQLTTNKNLRRIGPLPLPGKEFSVEIFDRDRKRNSKKSPTRTSKFTTERPELKDYIKLMRELQTEVARLKKINEINHNAKLYKDEENNGIDERELKDNKQKESKKLKKNKHSYEHRQKVHREKNKVDDTEEDVKKTSNVSEDREDLERSAEIVNDDIHHHKSKKLVLRSFEPLSTAKDNAINKKHAKIRVKATTKVDNTALNISKVIKHSKIDKTPTKSIIKITEKNINETTTSHSFRRLVEAFPSLFEGNTLKQGLYPAHLWD